MFTQNQTLPTAWRLWLSGFLFLIAATQTYNLVQLLRHNQSNKTDLAEINHIRYGLLNADAWVQKTTAILEHKIDEFELNEQNKPELRQSVERLIDELIVQVDQIIREKNLSRNESWLEQLMGTIKQIFTDVLVDIQGLRSRVPEFTDVLFEELNRPGGKANIKSFLREKLSQFARNTFNPTDISRYQAVLAKHHCDDGSSCEAILAQNIANQHSLIAQKTTVIITLLTLVFAITLVQNDRPSRDQIIVLGFACIVLLLGGILTPMIEIEAKITELKFQLLGETMAFQNQVLYFQSKSITDVVATLTNTGQPGMVLVGVLVSLFSIVFPLAKIAASVVYYQDINGLQNNSAVNFFALKSSKWAMADVLVVALFMAYIGFSGLIGSQLAHLKQASRYVDVMTTDGTSLQPGFFLFLGFCIAGLVLSNVLEKVVQPSYLNYGDLEKDIGSTLVIKQAQSNIQPQSDH